MLGSESVEPLFVTSEISSLGRFDWALSQVRKNQKVTRKSWDNKRFFQLKQPNGPIEEVWLNGQSVPLEAVPMEGGLCSTVPKPTKNLLNTRV